MHPPTFGEFLHEFVGHYVALEGALWRTLALLLARPGRLTREYLAGRRGRYVLPLRLYLSLSFVFFVAIKLMPATVNEATMQPVGTPARAAAPVVHGGAGWLEERVERARQDPAGFAERLRARVTAFAPYGIFALLPLFAGVMRLAYRNRGMTYGEHYVFSLHLHSFWFVALLALALLPGSSDWPALVMPLYAVLAMREVYGGGWLATLARAALVAALYGIALVAAIAALVGTALSMA